MPTKQHRLFARYLAQHRTARGFTISQLAREAGIAKSSIHRWEAEEGLPAPELIEPLARALGVDYEEVFELVADPDDLPAFTPYLRTKYGELPDEAVAEAGAFFDKLTRRYEPGKGGGAKRRR